MCAALLIAACYPVTTTNPVGTTAGFSAAPELAGLWRAEMAHSKDEVVYFHFLPMEDGTFKVVIVSGGEKLGGDWSIVRVTVANLDSHHFLNAELVFNNGKQETDAAKGIVPLLYRVEPDGRISLYLMSEDAAKEAIQRGEIAGTIEPGDLGDVNLTAEPDDLDAFLGSDAGASLFTEKFATLTKMAQ
jgi:hypothetical protein